MSASTGGPRETRSTCPYCGVGCGVIIESDGVQITGVRGDPEHPANFGRLCTKGSALALTATAPLTRQARLLHPMQRAARGAPGGEAHEFAETPRRAMAIRAGPGPGVR